MSRTSENPIIYADYKKCVGCKQCELACATAHSGCSLAEARAAGYVLVPRIHVVKIKGAKVPMQCHQCEDAPCAHACPTGAIYQEDGIVKVNEGTCVGCKVCVMACPFGAIEVVREGIPQEGRTKRGKAKKCNLCINLEKNEDGMPSCSCVRACPTKALSFVTFDDYRKQVLVSRALESTQMTPTYKG